MMATYSSVDFSSPSSSVRVIDANSRASDNLKCASAMISDSSGYNSCLRASDDLKSVTAPGNLSFSREISANRSCVSAKRYIGSQPIPGLGEV